MLLICGNNDIINFDKLEFKNLNSSLKNNKIYVNDKF